MPTAVMKRGGEKMDRKVLSISSKRQITIPQKFYQSLGFGDEAECVMRDNMLIIRPVKTASGGEFAEQILSDLVAEGLSGEELLAEFKARQAKIRPAVEAMLAEAEAVAKGKAEYEGFDDVLEIKDNVTVNKLGDIVILVPKGNKWSGFLNSLELFSDDFMTSGREQQPEQEREQL